MTAPADGAPAAAPQLRMRRRLDQPLPPSAPAPGYAVQRLAVGDEAAWAALLHANRELGDWDDARARGFIAARRPEAIIVAVAADGFAATACANPPTAAEPRPELGWVAVAPAHQGRGLGRVVCAAVLEAMRARGHREGFLLTDDHRLAAIRTYLALGFEPEPAHPGHGARWEAVRARLGERG